MKNRDEILMEFSLKVKDFLGKSLSKIILYGSYARGDYRENSDIDLMILTTLTDNEIENIESKILIWRLISRWIMMWISVL